MLGMQNGTTTLKGSLALSYKTKDAFSMQSRHHTLWYLPKGEENLCPYKNLPTGVYGSFTHNC